MQKHIIPVPSTVQIQTTKSRVPREPLGLFCCWTWIVFFFKAKFELWHTKSGWRKNERYVNRPTRQNRAHSSPDTTGLFYHSRELSHCCSSCHGVISCHIISLLVADRATSENHRGSVVKHCIFPCLIGRLVAEIATTTSIDASTAMA